MHEGCLLLYVVIRYCMQSYLIPFLNGYFIKRSTYSQLTVNQILLQYVLLLCGLKIYISPAAERLVSPT